MIYWPYFTVPYFFPLFNHQNPQNGHNVQQFSITENQICDIQNVHNQNKSENNKWMNLTKQDLLEIGYGSVKNLWSEQQDRILKELIKKYKRDWDLISKELPGRNPKMCYSRFKRLENRTKNYWKKQEKDRIGKLQVKNLQVKNVIITDRTSKQVKEHYMNYLRPGINTEAWKIQDDLLLIELLNTFGTNWKEIQQRMNGRTQSQIKNRYFGKLLKLMNKKMQAQKQIN